MEPFFCRPTCLLHGFLELLAFLGGQGLLRGAERAEAYAHCVLIVEDLCGFFHQFRAIQFPPLSVKGGNGKPKVGERDDSIGDVLRASVARNWRAPGFWSFGGR